jgi:ATP-dependent Clp protease protease subunit
MSMVPVVVEQSSHGERSYDIFSKLLNDRIIVLSDIINDTTASLIVAQMLFLEASDPEKDIHFYINSPGGSITSGFAIYDTIQHIKPDVSTICFGMAASAGSFLLTAGSRGKRFALPNSEILIHQPWLEGGIKGQVTDIKIQSDWMQRTKDRLNRLYSERTGQPLGKIEVDMERDFIMTADEAKEYGLIDAVLVKKILQI